MHYVLRKHNKMKGENKNPEIAVEYTIKKQWIHIISVVRKTLRIKTIVFEEQSKIYYYLY